jgi:hypothetical protein
MFSNGVSPFGGQVLLAGGPSETPLFHIGIRIPGP